MIESFVFGDVTSFCIVASLDNWGGVAISLMGLDDCVDGVGDTLDLAVRISFCSDDTPCAATLLILNTNFFLASFICAVSFKKTHLLWQLSQQ